MNHDTDRDAIRRLSVELQFMRTRLHDLIRSEPEPRDAIQSFQDRNLINPDDADLIRKLIADLIERSESFNKAIRVLMSAADPE